MKAFILGDIHLGKGLNIGRPGTGYQYNSRIEDQINILDWVLETAKSNNVDRIICTGDIYEDTRVHPALIHLFMLWIKKCEKAGIKLDILVGNHDIIRSGSYNISALDIIPALEIPGINTYKEVTTINFDKISFTYMPYRDRRMYGAKTPEDALNLLKNEFEGHLEQIPKDNIKIIIGHLALDGSLYVGDEFDDLQNEIFCPLDLFSGYDYVWMGHVHLPQVLLQKPHLAHIGSMDRSDFGIGETSKNKIAILIDTDNPYLYKEIVIPTRNLRKIEIKVPADKDITDFCINSLYVFDKDKPLKDSYVNVDISISGNEYVSSNRDKILRYICDNLEAFHVSKFSEHRILFEKQADDTSDDEIVLFDTNADIVPAIEVCVPKCVPAEYIEEVKQLALALHEENK